MSPGAVIFIYVGLGAYMTTSERNSGIRALLSRPWIYDAFQAVVGATASRKWIAEQHLRVRPGMTVVDVGCGTGALRTQLPVDVSYFGFDPSSDYIASAKRCHSGDFSTGTMRDFLSEYGHKLAGRVDLVVCMGVLHHMNASDVAEVLSGAALLLNSSGRFCGVEPAFLVRQDRLSRWVLKQDRGTSIRQDVEWQRLLGNHFGRSEVQVANNLLRIPYVHALLTGWQTADVHSINENSVISRL